MIVYELQNAFGLENLKPVERAVPSINDNQVLVKIEARSVNYRDYLMITGKYNPNQKLPLVPFSDGAGTVIKTGRLVTSIKEGDRVTPIFSQNWFSGCPTKDMFQYTLGGPLDGTLVEYAVYNEKGVVKFPEYLSFAEASTLPCAALTAWNSLFYYSHIEAGNTVLIQGTGGVSIFALQMAKAVNATVILLSSDNSKLDYAKKMGADYVINYKDYPNWSEPVLDITKNIGVDQVLEVGGANTLELSIKSVRSGGHVSLIGVLGGGEASLSLRSIFMRNIQIQGIIVGNREQLEMMYNFLEDTKITPLIDITFPFAKAVQAVEHLKQASHIGKICVV